MKAIFLDNESKTCFVTGTNEELSKVLDACNYHTELAPKKSIFGDGDLCSNYAIEDDDKLHVVCIEKQYNAKWDSYYSFVYEALPFTPDDIHFPIELDEDIELDDISTPDDVSYIILNCFDEEIARTDNFNTDTINDFLEWFYDGRVIDEKEYVEFDNLSKEEKDMLMFDLSQVSFYKEGSPVAHVLHEIEERIPSRFEELATQSNGEDLLDFVRNFPQARKCLNKKPDDEKLNIIKHNWKIIDEIDYPSLEMVEVAYKAKEDFQRRNLIGVKTMIEELEETRAWCLETDHVFEQDGDFERECDQIAYFYATEKGLPKDLAEDVALNPEESIERLHDGSYMEYWAEMAITGHYEEDIEERREAPAEKPKYLVMSKICGECGAFKTLEEATARIKECKELDKNYETFEKDCYQIVDPFLKKEVAVMKHRDDDFER